jgi:hypothetical protein
MCVSSSQASIISELFVRRADENYITARWCAMNQLHTDFAWLAVHAMEKYLKAVLLYKRKAGKEAGARHPEALSGGNLDRRKASPEKAGEAT